MSKSHNNGTQKAKKIAKESKLNPQNRNLIKEANQKDKIAWWLFLNIERIRKKHVIIRWKDNWALKKITRTFHMIKLRKQNKLYEDI